MQLPIVQYWIVKIRTAGEIVLVDPGQRDADQRDLQHACAKLSIFLRGADFLPDHVVESKQTKLLMSNRDFRVSAFAAGSMKDILQAKSIPVQYDQLPKDLKKSGSFKKNKSGCINI
jgi:hypothetical protein